MAKPNLPKGKKRYYLSLTQDLVTEFQTVSKELKMPSSFMSHVCEESISKTLHFMKLAQSKGNITVVDLFTLMGQNMEELVKENVNAASGGSQAPAKKRQAKKAS